MTVRVPVRLPRSTIAGSLIGLAFVAGCASPPVDRPIGGALGCRPLPHFVAGLGFSPRSALSTGEHGLKGLALVDLADPSRTFQDPSWSRFGVLGPITYDVDGNVFVAPTPNVSMLDNPVEQQNTVLKVDTDSGVMAPLVALPPTAPLSAENPFGILGLTYDCDTRGLYASSVAGSTRRREVGQIVRLDPRTGAVIDRLPGVDAMGLAVFNGARGRRLYFGAAREPEIRAVALDAAGRFSGAATRAVLIPGLADRARRITFDAAGGMTVVGVPFAFTLNAASRERQTEHRFSYDPATDSWRPQAAP